MAENKKSFIAYSDWYGMLKACPDDVAGKLIKHVFAYVNDENPSTDDFIINALFEQIKSTLKRDLVKWEEQREQRSLAGKKSAEQRATKSNDRSTPLNETQRNPTVSVSVNDNVINNNTPAKADDVFDFSKYLETLNQKFSRSFKVVNEKTKKQIKARLKEKYTKQDIIDAMNNCLNSDFHKNNGYQYCTPEFFSRADILDRWSDITKPKQSKVNIEL